jgi:hypothetical protein
MGIVRRARQAILSIKFPVKLISVEFCGRNLGIFAGENLRLQPLNVGQLSICGVIFNCPNFFRRRIASSYFK